MSISKGYICNYLIANGNKKYEKKKWRFECLCVCGDLRYYDVFRLRKLSVQSCGCKKKPMPDMTTHGKTKTSIYCRWHHIKRRCTDPTHISYHNYGGRGITLCEEWFDFSKFYSDMGDAPLPKMQIDRIDNEKGYSKQNCRWVSPRENCQNKRDTILVPYKGQMLCASAVAIIHNIKQTTFIGRLHRGWNIDDAINIPVQYQKPHNQPSVIT